jgi:hypothetical protein
MAFALTGKDTIIINDRLLNDFGTGDVCTLTFPNDLTDILVGKNGNTIFTYNLNGRQADVEIKVVQGSPDDKFLNSLFLAMTNDFAAFKLLKGEFTKRIGDGSGAINSISFNLQAGTFKKGLDTKENVEGDKDQAQVMYKLAFSSAERSIS